MHPVRDKMNKALKTFVAPKLRLLGFKGSFPHYRRVHGGHVDLLTFQFNKYGGSFVAEIGQLAESELAAKHWSPNLSLESATVYDANKRHRLGSMGQGDHWFIYGKENDQPGHEHIEADSVYEGIARNVAAIVESEGETWWHGR